MGFRNKVRRLHPPHHARVTTEKSYNTIVKLGGILCIRRLMRLSCPLGEGLGLSCFWLPFASWIQSVSYMIHLYCVTRRHTQGSLSDGCLIIYNVLALDLRSLFHFTHVSAMRVFAHHIPVVVFHDVSWARSNTLFFVTSLFFMTLETTSSLIRFGCKKPWIYIPASKKIGKNTDGACL